MWFKKKYSRIPLIRINWDGEPSVYAENPDNLIFLLKYAKLAVRSGVKKFHKRLLEATYLFVYK
jgi:hypothetical protein